MNPLPATQKGQLLASATALLLSLAVLTLAALGFAKADSGLGLLAAKQGIITLEVLSN